MRNFSIRVPATIANLGPGFDSLGLAVKKYLEMDVAQAAGPMNEYEINICGRQEDIPFSENAVLKAMIRGAEVSGGILPPHRVIVKSDIPLKKGLGSSAAARVAGIMAGSILSGKPCSAEGAALEASRLEGHADNAYPAALGGLLRCAVSGKSLEFVKYERFEVTGEIGIAVAVPNIEISTDDARGALPASVSFEDAVFSSSRAAMLVSSLVRGDFENLDFFMQDRLHQPYRKKLIPGFDAVARAALGAGAWGAAICGSGPSVFCFASPGIAGDAGRAMAVEWEKSGIAADFFVTGPDCEGAIVSERDFN